MPKKRSKSEEREKKRKYRENRGEDRIQMEKEIDRERKKTKWNEKNEEEKNFTRNYIKMNVRKFRAKKNVNTKETRQRDYDEKAANKERIRIVREKHNEEERENAKEEARIGMAALRQNYTDKERKDEREAAKARMRKFRAEETNEEKRLKREKARIERAAARANITNEDVDYENVVKRLKMRKLRERQSGKEHLTNNLEAKKGMRLFNAEGRLRQFSRRMKKNHKKEELLDWKMFWEKSAKHEQKLTKTQPDIVEKINQEIRIQNEKKRRNEKKLQDVYTSQHVINREAPVTECTCDYDVDCPYCTEIVDREKGLLERFEFSKEDDADEFKEYKEMKNKLRREKYQAKRNKAIVPIPSLPERELSEYEKIREERIKQLKKEWVEYEAKWEAEWELKK